MMNRLATLLLATLGLVLLAPTASASDHEDERLGFRIKIPRDWKQAPLRKEERWIVANYVSDKKDYYTDGDTNYTRTHTPTLRVVAFVHEVINRPDFEEEDEDNDESTVRVRLQRVYQDYKEFLRETDSDGHYYAEEETGKVGDIEVDQYVIRKETATGTGNRLDITWVYHLDIAEVAVEFEVLEDSYKKMKSTIEKTLKNFKTIERTKGLDIDHMSGDVYISLSDLRKLSPEDRALRRQEQQRLDWQRIQDTLPEGWESLEIDGIPVAHHPDIDDKFCKETVGRIQAVMTWMDSTFEDIGKGEYVRGPIVRICRDREEELDYRDGSEGAFVTGTELVTHKDKLGYGNWTEIVSVGTRTMQIWFVDRDFDVYQVIPPWMAVGMGRAFQNADVRGKKLKFTTSDGERWLKTQCRDKEPYGIRELLTMTGKEWNDRTSNDDLRTIYQSSVMGRFLTDRKNKDVLADYVTNLRDVLEEIQAEEKEKRENEDEDEDDKKPANEEEEEKMFKERQERLRAIERRLLESTFERTFGEWSDKEWGKFEKAYMKEVD